jgi:segregation and condensation protein B
MSDEQTPEPPQPRQLSLVSAPEEPEAGLEQLPEVDLVEDESAAEEDNLVMLPGLHPADTLGWVAPGDEEEEDPREGLPDVNELVPPGEEMLDGVLEALLLTADEPLSIAQLNTYLAGPGVPSVRDAVHRISARLKRGGSGIRLVEVAKGWQLRTDIRTAPWVAAMRGQAPLKLSKAALETLAIVAYRQPVSRAEVEDLRGVDPGGILRMLCERGLICVAGRRDAPGRPLLYGTTLDFLGLFGLRDLSDLPTLRDLRELQADDPREGIGSTATDIESTLLDAFSQDPLDDQTLDPDILPMCIPMPVPAPTPPTEHSD